MRIEATDDEAGRRVESLLADRLGVSRSQAHWYLSDGRVSVNGRRLTLKQKGLRIAAGDAVEVVVAEHEPVAEDDPAVRIVAEGDGWIAVDKPAGMPVHPLSPGERGTVLNTLLSRYPRMLGVGEGGLRSGVVHRLDLETSGVLVFATEQARWQRLREAFSGHAVEKIYHALLSRPVPPGGEQREALHLAVTRHKPARVAVVSNDHPGARLCTLRWRVSETFATAALAEVQLETGFLHQVRVTMAHLGRPLLGDRAYGGPMRVGAIEIPRVMLHARRLQFEDVVAEAPPPRDFAAVVGALRGLE